MALSGSTVVGGAVVMIGGDLTDLIAAEQQAKAITVRIGQMKAAAGIGGGTVGGIGGGMGPGAQWMTGGIMPSGTGAVALGGGMGTATAGPGMSAMDAAFRRLAASGTAASAAIDRMALAADNAANSLAGVMGAGGGTGTSGSGGSGGSGTGRAGGTRRTPNLFSVRGLASKLGIGITGVFAALEGIKIASAYAHVADTEAHPERTRDAMSMGSKYGIEGNSVLSGVASQTDALSNQKATREVFESIPLVGTLVKFTHALDGSTQAIEENAKRLQRVAQLNEKSIAMIDAGAVAHAEEHGKEGAGKLQSLEQEWRAANAHVRESVKTGDQDQIDEAVAARKITQDNIRDQVAKIKAQRLAREGDGTAENPGTESILADATRHRIWSTEEQSKIAHLKAIGSDPAQIYEAHKRQILDSQQAAREESGAAYDTQYAGATTLEKHNLQMKHRREIRATQAKNDAELSELDDRRLEEKQTADRESSIAAAGAGAARLRQGGRQYAAEELTRRAHYEADLEKTTDPGLRKAKGDEFYAGVAERKQIEGRRKHDVMEKYQMDLNELAYTTGINAHTGEAVWGHQHGIDAMHLYSGIQHDIRDARAGDEQTMARKAGVAKLDQAIYKLNAVGGGAFGITTKRNMIVGDPLDLSGEARDRAAAEKQLQDDKKKVQAGLDAANGAKPNLPGDTGWWANALTALQTIATTIGSMTAQAG